MWKMITLTISIEERTLLYPMLTLIISQIIEK